MLIDTTPEKPETYSRNSKEPRTIKEAMECLTGINGSRRSKMNLTHPLKCEPGNLYHCLKEGKQ
jgi:hypothetical protein